MIFQGKLRSRDLKSSKFSGLAGAAPQRGPPARPRRLEAGAAESCLFSCQHIVLLSILGARPHGTTPARGGRPSASTRGEPPPSTPLSGATLPHPGAPPARPRGERRHVSATPRHVAPSSPLLCASSRGAWPRPCPVPRSVSLPCGGSGAGTTRAPSQAAPLLRWPHGTPLTVVLLPPRSPSLSAQEPLLS